MFKHFFYYVCRTNLITNGYIIDSVKTIWYITYGNMLVTGKHF